ncbi:conserved hypothetical protein [Leishmania braziliensis MHOM/BR/75/M2904]|uniref:Uncharacterized protein n=1 Tax=Leishmania braziliensis TaxID=5660 RepID=A4HC92_LEIBR|nr:conserved hypothetical protein [Leishmania braziliensis MHOM/BR/75/M2904]CAJ2472760.1 unnamed protein product [Leishmania braziliensis]CAM45085.2 conserved hypothetical protein [Leishmania braziliensis MHOM/BR/75/M2904]
MRAERLRELEGFLQQRGGQRTSIEDRHKVIQKALSLLPVVYPPLTKVVAWMRRYSEDVVAALHHAAEDKAEALKQQQKELYEQFETFFEGKIRELMRVRKQATAEAEAEHAAAFALRQERDVELLAIKEQLVERMNSCEKTEDQFRDFRHLIASVFQANQQLGLRIEQLVDTLADHNIPIPPASSEVMALQTSSDGQQSFRPRASNADGDDASRGDSECSGGRRRDGDAKFHNVPVEFMAAAKHELVKSRLTLQEELLHSAFDDRCAYRMRIAGLTQQNLDLKFNVSELEEKVRDLYTYVHEKRFVRQVDEQGDEAALTPRPREVPLALQTELGIELRHSTANILSELSTLAINMKHQLNAALLRARQLHTLSTWLDEGNEAAFSEGAVGGMLQRVSEATVIPVFPVSAWQSIPHFLRTTITPDVPNYYWTEAQAACILHNFFKAYRAIRRRARFVRDSKMLAPRTCQLFEHREVLLTRLDASKEDVAATEENVPFGYVVTQFARDVLSNLSPQNVQAELPLVLPGTVALRLPTATITSSPFNVLPGGNSSGDTKHSPGLQQTPTANERLTVEDCPWKVAVPIVELELTRFTYNMWYAAVRYQPSQPLCDLFLKLVDGQMPIETFDLMEAVLSRLRRRIECLDGDGTRRFAYSRLVKGIVRSVTDMDAKAVLRAVQAVAQAFEANHMPLYGGALDSVALFADETYCKREAFATSFEEEMAQCAGSPMPDSAIAEAAAKKMERTPLPSSLITHEVPLPTSFTASSPPSMLPPVGATCIVRFCRHLVHDTVEGLYTRIEAVLCPLVEESEVVLGLYLLPLPRAKAALAALDDMTRQEAIHAALVGSPEAVAGSSLARVTIGRISAAAYTGMQLTAEAANLLGVRGLTHDYMNLLESRRNVVEEKRTEERHITAHMVDKAVQGLPRFKTSTHFPFHSQHVAWIGTVGELTDGNVLPKTDSLLENDATLNKAAAAAAAAAGSESDFSVKITQKGRKHKLTQAVVGTHRSGHVAEQHGSEKADIKARSSTHATHRRNKRLKQANLASLKGERPDSAEYSDAVRSRTAKALLAASEEGDLVEWYSLRHALRCTLPSLPWQIFQPDEPESEQEKATIARTSGPGTLPVLTASEVKAAS